MSTPGSYEGFFTPPPSRPEASGGCDPLGILALDPRGRILSANPQWLQCLGYRPDDVIGRPLTAHVASAERSRLGDVLRCLATGGRLRHASVTVIAADGAAVPVEMHADTETDATGRVVRIHCVLQCLTGREQRLQDQLRESQKMEAVGLLAGGVAHDFNNLLQAIRGYTELAQSDLPEGHPARDSLRSVQRATDRARDLTQQLLLFSRSQQSRPRPVELRGLLSGLREPLQQLLGDAIELVVGSAEGLPRLEADPDQIELVLRHLCDNARDAMPDGGRVTIDADPVQLDGGQAVARGLRGGGDYVRIRVADTGGGIPDAVADQVFAPFFTTKEVGKGSGLGLATVYGIVQQHAGTISCRNVRGGTGAIFEILLPAAATCSHDET